MVQDQLDPSKNAFLQKVDPAVLGNLHDIHFAASCFHIEDKSYQEAKVVSTLPQADDLGDVHFTGGVRWMFSFTRAPLVQNPLSRTVPVIAGDDRLYVGGYGINGEFAKEWATRLRLSLDLRRLSQALHETLLVQAQNGTSQVAGGSLQEKLKIRRTYTCCDNMMQNPLCGVAFLHLFAEPVFGRETPGFVYAVGPKGKGTPRSGYNLLNDPLSSLSDTWLPFQ